jgi:superfamily II DNA helicase RecQ
VYCLSRRGCEDLSDELRQHGVQSVFYHADMADDEKRRVQSLWAQGKAKVIVATIAFGMGINKPDVRFVVHANMPKSVEGYYQVRHNYHFFCTLPNFFYFSLVVY